MAAMCISCHFSLLYLVLDASCTGGLVKQAVNTAAGPSHMNDGCTAHFPIQEQPELLLPRLPAARDRPVCASYC